LFTNLLSSLESYQTNVLISAESTRLNACMTNGIGNWSNMGGKEGSFDWSYSRLDLIMCW
jgi:hypothetical protein